MKQVFTLIIALAALPLFIKAQNKPRFKTYYQGYYESDAFTTNNFKAIAVGKGNRIWAGTQYGGLYTLDDSADIWRKSDKLTDVFINDIKADADSGIWIAQSGVASPGNNSNIAGGVNYFRVASDISMEFYSVTGTTTGANILSRNVRSIYLDPAYTAVQDRLPKPWVAQGTYITSNKTARGGLSIGLNPYVPYFNNISDGFVLTPNATPICEAVGGGNGEVWVAVRQNGGKSQILRYNPLGKFIGAYTGGDTTTKLLPAGFTAQAIYFDKAGNRWIGLKSGGLVILTPNGWKQMNWESKIPPGTQINYNAITEDEYGNVYIGTSSGLLEFLSKDYYPASDPENVNAYNLYTTNDSLPSNNITGVAYDKKNKRLLITSSGGVTFMNKQEQFIKGVVYDVYTAMDSTNPYAGLQKIPLHTGVTARLLLDGEEKESTQPDNDGIFELKEAQDDKNYTVEIKYVWQGKTIKYLYPDTKNHTLMEPSLIPDSLIGEINTFKAKMENRCFTLKLPFFIEINNLTCVDGFYLDDYGAAYQPFYNPDGISSEHDKHVQNLADYYAALNTVYLLGGFAADLSSDMITNGMDAAESLTAFAQMGGPVKEKLTYGEFVEQENALIINGLKLMKEGFSSAMNLVSSQLSSYPRAKDVFDKSVSVVSDASDLAIDYIEKNDIGGEKYGAQRKALFDNAKKVIATGGAALFYKYIYARNWHKTFVSHTSNASKDMRSDLAYAQAYDALYNPNANSLAKWAKDTLDSKKATIETLVKTAKVAESAGGILDAATTLAIVPGGQVAAAIAKGLATASKAVRTFSLGLAMGEGGIGAYHIGTLSDSIIPSSGLKRNAGSVLIASRESQAPPTELVARKDEYNQKLAALQAVYNAAYDSLVYKAKLYDFSKADSAYTRQMSNTLNSLWASTDDAIQNVPGFKGSIEKVIDSFVTRQYTMRQALFFQNLAYRFDPDKSSYIAELNSLSNQIKVLNDSSVTGIAMLIDMINTASIAAPAYLAEVSHSLNHSHEPGTPGSVTYTFTNFGGEAQQNVSFKISQPTNGFVITSADSVNVGTIQPGQSKQVAFSFMSPSAEDSITLGYYDVFVHADNGSYKDLSGTLYIFRNPALPVGLSKFDVTCSGEGAKLLWQTSSEENSSYFQVEKSNDGINWSPVGKTSAAGHSIVVKQYAFTDAKGGSALYRLKQVDKDGQFTYSSVKATNCRQKQTGLIAYPVPAKNFLNIVADADRNSVATISIIDFAGRTAKQVSTVLNAGTNNFMLNIAGLPAGQYLVRMAGPGIIKTQKITVAP